MRIRLAIGSALIATAGACAVLLAGGAGASHDGPGFKTEKPAYLVPAAPGVVVDPILSTSDIIGGYQMSGIPDGLGAYKADRGGEDDDGGRGEFVTVMNHELGRTFPARPPLVDARISRLEIDAATRSVHGAEYLFTGQELFERFCSATLAEVFGRPFYFTGEEAVDAGHDGSSIVLDPETGMWRETPHFGRLQHENIVPLRLRKWIFLTTDDDFRLDNAMTPDVNERQDSYLYAYIADDFNKALRGVQGSLHVWRAKNWAAETGNATATKGETIPGEFVPIPQSANTDDDTLKAAAAARNAFKFDRLEDLAVRPGQAGRTYFADTGKPPTTERGRIYQFDINRRDPTQATLKMILNGDPPDNDDIVNPDNMDASKKVLVIQEDREGTFRNVPNRVLVHRFGSPGVTTVAEVVVPGVSNFNAESSGVIDASHVLGKNWWLLDVQAHNITTAPQPGPDLTPGSSVGEDGQLLAIKIPGSQGSGNDDDD
jgi:hypothetical protein